MSDQDPKVTPESTQPKLEEAAPAKKKAPKASTSQPKPDKKKAKAAKAAPKNEFAGRVASISLSNASGRVTDVKFELKNKKGKNDEFSLAQSHASSLDSVAILLATALSTKAKVRVKLDATGEAAGSVVSIEIHGK